LISLEIRDNFGTGNLVMGAGVRLGALLVAAKEADLPVETSEQMRSGWSGRDSSDLRKATSV
jgi:hypothetical protein